MERNPYITLNDGTEITYSNIKNELGREVVYVYFERPNRLKTDFDSMDICLPNGEMRNIVGYKQEEIQLMKKYLDKLEPLIFEFAREE